MGPALCTSALGPFIFLAIHHLLNQHFLRRFSIILKKGTVRTPRGTLLRLDARDDGTRTVYDTGGRRISTLIFTLRGDSRARSRGARARRRRGTGGLGQAGTRGAQTRDTRLAPWYSFNSQLFRTSMRKSRYKTPTRYSTVQYPVDALGT